MDRFGGLPHRETQADVAALFYEVVGLTQGAALFGHADSVLPQVGEDACGDGVGDAVSEGVVGEEAGVLRVG